MNEGTPKETMETVPQAQISEAHVPTTAQETLERSVEGALADESLEPEDREKVLRRALNDIDGRKAELKKVLTADAQKVADARARLGLSADTESAPQASAFKHEVTQLDAMRDKVEKALIALDASVETSERAVGIRKETGRVAEALAGLLFEMNNRDRKGYDPFVDKGLYSFLRSSVSELADFSQGKGDVSAEEVARLYGNITRGIKGMQSSPRGTSKDSPDSLRAMTQGFMALNDSIRRTSRFFREGDENAAQATQGALRATDALSQFMSQKYDALRRYMNGR